MPDGIRLPGAIWKPFTERTVSDLKWSGPGAIVGHTMVGSRDGSWDYHNEPGMPYVQLYYDHLGVPFQTTGLEYRAAGTLELNPYVIALEFADKGPGFPDWGSNCGNVPPMTDAQVAAAIRDVAWMCIAFQIDPRRMANTCEALPGGPGGIGVHRDGIDPWRAEGCPKGSNSAYKCCPDNARIAQWEQDIIPGVRAIVLGGGTPQPPVQEDDDMPKTVKLTVPPASEGAPQTYAYLLPDGTVVDRDYNGSSIDGNDAKKFDVVLLTDADDRPTISAAAVDQVQEAIKRATKQRNGAYELEDLLKRVLEGQA